MTAARLYHSFRLRLISSPRKRAAYIRKHGLFDAVGSHCYWGPVRLPLYPELIRLHNNVVIHKSAWIITHDLVNTFLKRARPEMDFGYRERLGCVEIMDNVYVANKVTIMPGVRIGSNCIISTGSVVMGDIPDNSVVAGNPAKVIGRFDMYCAMRRMNKNINLKFKNQALPETLAKQHWELFDKKYADK